MRKRGSDAHSLLRGRQSKHHVMILDCREDWRVVLLGSIYWQLRKKTNFRILNQEEVGGLLKFSNSRSRLFFTHLVQ